MAAEIRVDRITSRTGINTITFSGDSFFIPSNVGIGTTNVAAAANASNVQKISVGVVTANYYYGDGSFLTGVTAGNKTTTSGITTTSAVGIGSFATATYRSARARVQITQGSNYQISELHLIHDGTTASFIEPSTIATGSILGTFSVAVVSSNYEIKVALTSTTSATVETYLERLTV